ncbi:MAG: rRNA maturation RNase YbeY [Succinivibrionaceae bacterium]|nr:rRNA maturation RNase YbeY [Succinivibrionaceae bacterium]
MGVCIDLQDEVGAPGTPRERDFARFAARALEMEGHGDRGEITVRIVAPGEIQALNRDYRKVDRPTNILSFPADLPAGIAQELGLLGDLVICHEVVLAEARAQGITPLAHYAHLTVHGCLHLLGYDHIEPADAAVMEPLEVSIVQALGFENPYHDEE